MAEFDLLPKITPYLDKHLLFPLLEHVQKLQVPSLAINFQILFVSLGSPTWRATVVSSSNVGDILPQSQHGKVGKPPDEVEREVQRKTKSLAGAGVMVSTAFFCGFSLSRPATDRLFASTFFLWQGSAGSTHNTCVLFLESQKVLVCCTLHVHMIDPSIRACTLLTTT